MNQSPHEVVLAFDFSLDRLDISLHAPDDTWPIPHRAYDNNWPGFLTLKQDVLTYLHQHQDSQLTAVGESTGLLWWHAFYHLATDPDLAAYQPRLALLNPAHVKYFRKALPEQDKTDITDPHLIDRYYRVSGIKHPHTFNPRYLPLRQLSRAYCRLTHTLAAEKAFCLSLLYLTASEYQRLKPFGNNLGATGRHILTEYPDIAAIADMPLDDLAALLHKRAHGRLTNPRENATKLHQVVQDSYPLAEELVPAVQIVLAQTLAHIDFLEKQKKTYLQHITAALDALPEAKPALAISGLGPTLVAGCLAEIQDTRRFITGRKFDRQKKRWRQRTYRDGQAAVAKLAGLWWPQNSSGRFVGKDRPLARERNPYLSYWFVQAAYSLKGRQSDYAAYYNRKFREVTKHRHRRALILTARKAVRLIFALLHKGQMAQLKEAATT